MLDLYYIELEFIDDDICFYQFSSGSISGLKLEAVNYNKAFSVYTNLTNHFRYDRRCLSINLRKVEIK